MYCVNVFDSFIFVIILTSLKFTIFLFGLKIQWYRSSRVQLPLHLPKLKFKSIWVGLAKPGLLFKDMHLEANENLIGQWKLNFNSYFFSLNICEYPQYD